MANKSSGRYYAKNTENGTFADITTLFDGVAVLKVDGFNAKGKPVNVYTAQWVNNQAEDFLITTLDESNNPVVIRENTDIEITFIVKQKYASSTINVLTQHDEFVNYMTNSDVWIKSAYMGNKYAHCVCLKEYKPTKVKLQRGNNSYIMGTIELHTLDMPQDAQPTQLGDLYIGFGGATISDPAMLANVQHVSTNNPVGGYTITCPSTSYLWICFSDTISGVVANGFEVPMNNFVIVGNLKCYRSTNDITPHIMNFTITN